jgi:Na+/melibiose symporter-like transporter
MIESSVFVHGAAMFVAALLFLASKAIGQEPVDAEVLEIASCFGIGGLFMIWRGYHEIRQREEDSAIVSEDGASSSQSEHRPD